MPSMPKLVSLQRPKAAIKAQRERMSAAPSLTNPDDEGVRVDLEHHHLMALKGADGGPIAGQMKSGHRVSFSGDGTVERSESRSTKDGERHSATLRMHKGAVTHHAPAAARPDQLETTGRKGTPKYPKIAKEYVS